MPPTLPQLQTERLLLTPRTLADTGDCLAMDRHAEVTRFVSGPWGDPAAHRAFVEARTLGPYPEGQGYWVIRPKARPAAFLGWALLIPLDAVGPETEIGWRLTPSAWGFGYAAEAAMAVLGHAFDRLGLPEVVADIHPGNVRSRRVAEKLGLVARAARLPHGAPHDRFAISDAEWRAAARK
jgi:RimJ/RimL family protein N-acetyltransferase